MPAIGSEGLVKNRFRAARDCKLILWDRLSTPIRQSIPAGPDAYGVVMRIGQPAPIKLIDRDVALLFYSLNDPGPIPEYARRSLGDQAGAVIARLVLEGILEMELGGTFVSGPSAAVCLHPPITEPPVGTLAKLSRTAIEHVNDLNLDDARTVAARLYCFNAIPFAPRWTRIADAEQGLEADRRISQLLASGWVRDTDSQILPQWRVWRSVRRLHIGSRPHYKLYVSPVPSCLHPALELIARTLSRSDALALKVGAGVRGLLRPDKIVAYFPDQDSLARVGADLARDLRPFMAQGVPFTAPIASNALVSWGCDPDPATLLAAIAESWRSWLTAKLAVALVEGRSSPTAMTPVAFAMAAVTADGVDTVTWMPVGVAR